MGLAIFVIATIAWWVLALISCVILYFAVRAAVSHKPSDAASLIGFASMFVTPTVTWLLVYYLSHSKALAASGNGLILAVIVLVTLPFILGVTFLICAKLVRLQNESRALLANALECMGIGALTSLVSYIVIIQLMASALTQ